MAEKSPSGVVPIVGIGGGVGALEPLSELLAPVEEGLGCAFVVVLSDLDLQEVQRELQACCKVPVEVLNEGEVDVELDRVYLAAVPTYIESTDDHLAVSSQREPDRSQPLDFFFTSLAHTRRARAVAIFLSGRGSDGSEGVRAIRSEGGITLVQHEGCAHHSELPRSIIATGCADSVLTPSEMAHELVHLLKHPLTGSTGQAEDIPGDPESLHEIFRLLRRSSGVDFSNYKPTTIRRRLVKRMLLKQMPSLEEYLELVRAEPAELGALYEEFLVNVTDLFRDPELYDVLREEVFPALLDQSEGEAIRMWVPGCSQGDEAYSLAMTMLEVLRQRGQVAQLQVFATDINETALSRARSGRYPETAVERLPDWTQRFFVKLQHGYQINKSVRDLCVFARQDVTQDPPFSRLSLISCRNLMIYLSAASQKRVLHSFHYALAPDGYLVLGTSESADDSEGLFELVDKRNRIYRKRSVPTPNLPQFRDYPRFEPARVHPPGPPRVRASSDEYEIQKQADRLILARYGPAGVIVDENLEVLQFRGRTGAYLEPPTGTATHNLLKMAREGLLAPLKSCLEEVRKTLAPTRRDHVRVRTNGGYTVISLEVLPVRLVGSRGEYLLVLFQEESNEAVSTPTPAPAGLAAEGEGPTEAELTELRHELYVTREYLSAIIQERESANEELKAASEEAQSANEELQSANEELETAKEELQSTNEELATINEELYERNCELHRVNSDLHNILSSVDVPVVVLDSDFLIQRFTPTAKRLLNLIPGDVGRPFSQVRANIEIPGLETELQDVLDTLVPRTFDHPDNSGRWWSVRVRPYRTADDRIDGVVIAFVDIDELRGAREEAGRFRDLVTRLLELMGGPALIVDHELAVVEANEAFIEAERKPRTEVVGQPLGRLTDGCDGRSLAAEVERRLGDVLETEETLTDGGGRTARLRVLRDQEAEVLYLLRFASE